MDLRLAAEEFAEEVRESRRHQAIKELGTNGGGFYNANSAHPFENPNAVTRPDQLHGRDLIRRRVTG